MPAILRHWFFVILWAGLIFILSSVPRLESGLEQDFLLRKLAHIFEYFVLTWFLYSAFSSHYLEVNKKHPPHRQALLFVLLLAVFYAVSDELHQTFVFGRSGNLRDVAIDLVGILTAIIFLYWRRVFR